MSETNDERIAKAAMRSLRAEAPADLTAALKRRARARSPKPSLWEGLREAFSQNAWAYGAGAAFAAAGVVVAIVKAVPERPPLVVEAPVAAAPVAQADLAALWADDDGGDHD